MHKIKAQQIVSFSWSQGCEHPELEQALAALGMSRSEFNRLRREMRRVTKGRSRLQVLTPSGCGVRT